MRIICILIFARFVYICACSLQLVLAAGHLNSAYFKSDSCNGCNRNPKKASVWEKNSLFPNPQHDSATMSCKSRTSVEDRSVRIKSFSSSSLFWKPSNSPDCDRWWGKQSWRKSDLVSKLSQNISVHNTFNTLWKFTEQTFTKYLCSQYF